MTGRYLSFSSYFIILVLFFIFKTGSAQTTDLIQPVNFIESPRCIPSSIIIDGIAEGVYSSYNHLEYTCDCEENNETDISAYFQIAHSWEFLFLFVRVSDDSAYCKADSITNVQGNYDYIDFFCECSHLINDNGSYEDDAIHLRWYRGSDSAFFASSNWYAKADSLHIGTFEMDYVFIEDTINGNNYSFEAIIPIDALLDIGKSNEDLGEYEYPGSFFCMEISVGDSDNEADRDNETACTLFWDGDETGLNNAGFDTRTFGILNLQGIHDHVSYQELIKENRFPVNVQNGLITSEDIISIYTISGRYLGTGNTFTLEKGIYIAKRGKDAVKFIVW